MILCDEKPDSEDEALTWGNMLKRHSQTLDITIHFPAGNTLSRRKLSIDIEINFLKKNSLYPTIKGHNIPCLMVWMLAIEKPQNFMILIEKQFSGTIKMSNT